VTNEIPVAVANGAALLDEYIPNWYELIDPNKLDLNSPYQCILGQLSQHTDQLPRMVQKHLPHRGSVAFTVVLHALERVTGRYDIGLYEYGFIEEATWVNGHAEFHTNRKGWCKAIAARKQRDYDRAEERMNTAIAKQVKAGIDAELAQILAERSKAAYSLVA